MVNEHLSIQMIKLMLHDAGQISLNPFVMMLELFIIPLHMDAGRTDYFFMDGR